jgi:TnpA family transposase
MKLEKKLSYKGIWAKNTYRYRSPEKDIPNYVLQNQRKFSDELGLIAEEASFISSLKESLNRALIDFNEDIKSNDQVSILNNGHIKITPFVAQNPSENVSCIHQEILKKWGNINLIDAFKEASLRIGFTKRFTSVGKYSNISDDVLIMRLLLALYAIGSNTGLKRISSANFDIDESELKYIKTRFINASNIRLAIVDVVNEVLRIRDPKIWGEATTSVACDSKKIAAWDQNLLTQWHPRYQGQGIMVYWHVDTNALCIYSQSKTCNSSEVGSMIKGFLDHSTKMDMDAAYVDTHGQSTIGFGVSKLLNFNIFPRLKNISSQKLYTASGNDKAKLSNISNIIKDSIKWKDIETGYKDSIPYIIALKKGLIEADVFIKRFSKDNYNNPVYKALCEIGKVEKTIFLCRYLSDEKFRIEINAALNVVERLNSVMNFFFYGKVSGISSNDPAEQELSILCLQLLQVCAVYINTLLIQEIFADLSLHDKFKEEDYRALSPLICSHFNPYGVFIINLKDRMVIRGTR